MQTQKIFSLLLFPLFFSLSSPSNASKYSTGEEKFNNYIIVVQEKPDDVSDVTTWHSSLLSNVISDSTRLIYSYDKVVNGFAARLSKKEVEVLSKQNWFVDAHLSRNYKLATTHTPSFLGLRQSYNRPGNLWNISKMGEGMIIGIIDSGIAPGHPSFNDDGMLPPPAKWKGHCDFNRTICNNKLIGAKLLTNGRDIGHQSPTDDAGHGTHVASIAAGAFVEDATAFGNSFGLASGMAPRAHIAMYKACGKMCTGLDMLKAIEVAVKDGVDVLSLSISEQVPNPEEDMEPGPLGLSEDIIIGAFYAILHGVPVIAAAGNNGPAEGSVANDAPWILTVGASTTDRRIASVVRLQNGLEFQGETLNQTNQGFQNWMPLFHFNKTAPRINKASAKGSIVICTTSDLYEELKVTDFLYIDSASAMIIINDKENGYQYSGEVYPKPTIEIGYDDGQKLLSYVASNPGSLAKFDFKGAVFNEPNSPSVAYFSSRGPSLFFRGISKPDIIGPGMNILAARSSNVDTKPEFKFMLGTSMSTPHLSGIAALIKKVHPDWSPAAIKSAIMTTAYAYSKRLPIQDSTQLPADYLAIGAGHVNPSRAVDPGLVYDQKPNDYIPYLCGMGVKDEIIQKVVFPLRFTTCRQTEKISEQQLNYPSIRINMKENLTTAQIDRIVTNVGDPISIYRLKISVPKGVYATVRPRRLHFNKYNEQRRFTVTFRKIGDIQGPAQGQLRWISKKHVVRSPITIATDENADYAWMKCNNFQCCEK